MSRPTGLDGARVLITGGLGFLGSNLAVRLVNDGAAVTILDALLPPYGGNLFNIHEIKDRVRLNFADIRDEGAVTQLIQGQDVIFNLAAQVDYVDSEVHPLLDLDINCRGHLILLEACRKFNRGARILFSGSRMQYGRTTALPVSERQASQPLSVYGIHKLTGEHYHLMYHRTHGLPTTVFRIPNPYGIRHHMKHSHYGIVNWFIRQAMEGNTITIFGDGAQIRDYVYVEDMVEALVRAAVASEVIGEVVNVGSGQGTTFRDMVKVVVAAVGSGDIKQVPWPSNYAVIETGNYVADISKAKRLLDWEPRVSLEEGVAQTVAYYRRHARHYWPDPSPPRHD
jgi:UDP-glucose 4-epimerase